MPRWSVHTSVPSSRPETLVAYAIAAACTTCGAAAADVITSRAALDPNAPGVCRPPDAGSFALPNTASITSSGDSSHREAEGEVGWARHDPVTAWSQRRGGSHLDRLESGDAEISINPLHVLEDPQVAFDRAAHHHRVIQREQRVRRRHTLSRLHLRGEDTKGGSCHFVLDPCQERDGRVSAGQALLPAERATGHLLRVARPPDPESGGQGGLFLAAPERHRADGGEAG